MECPGCKATIERRHLPDGSLAFVCNQCGWGQDQAAEGAAEPGRPITFWLKFGLYWALTLLVLIGPYAGLRYAVVYFAGTAELAEGSPEAIFVGKLNLHYAWMMAVYLALCGLLTPSYDRDNMGIFGAGIAYNPAWTAEQRHNRMMRKLALAVGPGKIVIATLVGTWRLLRG